MSLYEGLTAILKEDTFQKIARSTLSMRVGLGGHGFDFGTHNTQLFLIIL